MPAINQAQPIPARWTAPRRPGVRAAPHGHLNLVAVPSPDDERRREGIGLERCWREMPQRFPHGEPRRILAQRWKEDAEGPREYAKAADARYAVLAIALRPTEARLTVDGEPVHDGPVPAGFATLTAPGVAATIHLRGPCDLLHLFIPGQRLREIAGGDAEARMPDDAGRCSAGVADPLIERLAWLLLKGGGAGEMHMSDQYVDGLAVGIVSRLLDCSRAREVRAPHGLVKWRLKRVQAYIEEKLSERLSLADLAGSAGLSRMHFAAQFRVATGMRPHEYVVRRRIQKAQEILLSTSMPLVEVALSVGFQTQAHFTTVFRRLLGETPGRWREAQRLA